MNLISTARVAHEQVAPVLRLIPCRRRLPTVPEGCCAWRQCAACIPAQAERSGIARSHEIGPAECACFSWLSRSPKGIPHGSTRPHRVPSMRHAPSGHSVMQRRRDQAVVIRRGHLRHSAPTEWLCAIAPFRSIGSLTAGGRSISAWLSESQPLGSVFEVASHNRFWPRFSPRRCAPAATWVSASCAKRAVMNLSIGGQPPGSSCSRNHAHPWPYNRLTVPAACLEGPRRFTLSRAIPAGPSSESHCPETRPETRRQRTMTPWYTGSFRDPGRLRPPPS